MFLRYFEMSPKNMGQYSKFSGQLLFTHGNAQTAFVMAHSPTSNNFPLFYSGLNKIWSRQLKVPEFLLLLLFREKRTDFSRWNSWLFSLAVSVHWKPKFGIHCHTPQKQNKYHIKCKSEPQLTCYYILHNLVCLDHSGRVLSFALFLNRLMHISYQLNSLTNILQWPSSGVDVMNTNLYRACIQANYSPPSSQLPFPKSGSETSQKGNLHSDKKL